MSDEGTFWIDEQAGELVFKDEDGVDRFIIEDELELDGSKYIILVPVELANDEEGEALLMKLIHEGDEELITIIEDDQEFEKVKKAYLNS